MTDDLDKSSRKYFKRDLEKKRRQYLNGNVEKAVPTYVMLISYADIVLC